MITSARQLKDKIRNLASEKEIDPQVLLRIYMMERLLERVSVSEYREKLILKGGMLVSSLVGTAMRSTMDTDMTIRGVTVSTDAVRNMVEEIISVPFPDGVRFSIKSVSTIMDEAEYPGIRVSMTAFMDGVRVPLKLDFSTGDVITPRAVEYPYKLMFEDRAVNLLSYNLETVIAEKLETIIARTTANTRMRDFYDIYILSALYRKRINSNLLADALGATSRRRGSLGLMANAEKVLSDLYENKDMLALWENYKSKFQYAADISWSKVLRSVRQVAISAGLSVKKPSALEAIHEPLPEKREAHLRPKRDVER